MSALELLFNRLANADNKYNLLHHLVQDEYSLLLATFIILAMVSVTMQESKDYGHRLVQTNLSVVAVIGISLRSEQFVIVAPMATAFAASLLTCAGILVIREYMVNKGLIAFGCLTLAIILLTVGVHAWIADLPVTSDTEQFYFSLLIIWIGLWFAVFGCTLVWAAVLLLAAGVRCYEFLQEGSQTAARTRLFARPANCSEPARWAGVC